MPQDHDQGAHNVHDRHCRNDLFGDSCHTLQAAQNDQRRKDDQCNAGNHIGNAERSVHIAGNGVDLAHVADAKRRQHAETGEQRRQHPTQGLATFLCAQTVGKVIHGTAAPLTFFVLAAVEDAQNIFRIVGHHAKDGHDPHPENGTWAAADDGRGHTHDITRANGGGKRRAKALELADGHILLRGMRRHIFIGEDRTDGVLHPVAEAPELKSPGPHRHDQTRAEQKRQTHRPPDHSIDRAVDARNGFQHPVFPLFVKNAGRTFCGSARIAGCLIPHTGAVPFSRQPHRCVHLFLPRIPRGYVADRIP